MNPRVLISPEAAADLESQLVYLLELDSEAARRLQGAVFNAFQLLATSPEIGVSRGFISARFKDLRMWPVSGFPLLLIYYVPRSSESIEIVRLLHARQDRDGVLGDEETYWSRDRRRSSERDYLDLFYTNWLTHSYSDRLLVSDQRLPEKSFCASFKSINFTGPRAVPSVTTSIW